MTITPGPTSFPSSDPSASTSISSFNHIHIVAQFRSLFNKYDETGEPSSDNMHVTGYSIKALQKHAWLGKLENPSLRGLCWRVFFGFLKPSHVNEWTAILHQQVRVYEELKAKTLPSVGKVEVDPLSSFSKGSGQSEEWRKFDQQVELANFITIDVDRLYMTGVEDEYFQRPEVKERIHTVLFVWSLNNERVSYRQGMHEIVGTVFYVLEVEKLAWEAHRKLQSSWVDSSFQHPLCNSFTDESIEAHTYFLFERIMKDMLSLYDPNPMTPDGVPPIVEYCTRIQGKLLLLIIWVRVRVRFEGCLS